VMATVNTAPGVNKAEVVGALEIMKTQIASKGVKLAPVDAPVLNGDIPAEPVA
jgi:hypothetical protein